ncbi:circularly permuted type 2 ATP-grasp protein [Longimicrobium sp.]|uniref:circularly permuted type 2 ATP-grasp protein n=1 Tax=Longimicrobium sp. TaxID=2029185 RepID=UPI002D043E14|nr:circularly permuted type 2 ATP-grasp protein [Longimicrobium sp.]HSU15366.1 circularly permuted type 2 ATP-grasp protein [Longimicrobium sp.]
MSAEALRRAIDAWHGLLGDEGLAADSAERMEQEHRSLGMYFGERALCTVLRPRFFTPGQWAGIRRGVETLMGAFRRAHEAAMRDPALLARFHLLDWERELVAQDPGFRSPCPTSRLDAFFDPDDGSLRFTEYNAETPAGPAYMDNLSEVFLALPVTGKFLRTHAVYPLPARHGVLHALLGAYAEWSGRRELPRIGILDWAEVPTYSEFVFFRDYFRQHGIACEIADPRTLEYREGKLMAGDFHITLIYKRVLIDELVLRMGMDNPVVRAVRDGAVCMVNPFRCKVLYKKASLAVLGDERNAHLFSPDEMRAIEAHVPWTRIVEARRTRFHGDEIDLLEWAEGNRERLVLKPNDDYGGRGIVLGWLVSDDEWRAALKTATETPYVLQERIHLPVEPFPSWVDGKVEIYDRMVDVAPFVTRTATIDGALTRIATDPLLNVTAGGGSSVATMLVEAR